MHGHASMMAKMAGQQVMIVIGNGMWIGGY
jgi:hypothetical protein